MIPLMLKDLSHHKQVWAWSLLVALTGATLIGAVTVAWWSALQWSLSPAGSSEALQRAHLVGSTLTGYAGLATAAVISSTLALTVAAQRRTHALWKVLGAPGWQVRRVVLGQVTVVGVLGGLLGGLLAPAACRWYLLTWDDFGVFPTPLPQMTPWFTPVVTTVVTTLFCVLGGLGAARRAASVPEMQALREASAPQARTRWWQWAAAGLLLVAVVTVPVFPLLPDDILIDGHTAAAQAQEHQDLEVIRSPAGRAALGGSVGLILAVAAMCVPARTLRPLLASWTRLVPDRFPAWFAARANALHRSTMSMTTIVPFAIAVAVTGTVYSIMGAGSSLGMSQTANGFLSVAVPVFIIAAVGGVANIAMVGARRRQEAALLGVLGATAGTVVRSTVLEGVVYAVTGVLFGAAATLVSALGAALVSGGGLKVLVAAVPWETLGPVVGGCLVLAVLTTWVPTVLDRRPAMERLHQPR